MEHILPVNDELQDAPTTTTSSTSDAMSPTSAAVAAALVVGALLFALALLANRSRARRVHARADAEEDRSSAAGDRAAAAFEARMSSRSRVFVENHVAAYDVVLFVDAARRNPTWPHFQTLLLTILAPLQHSGRLALVDLETTAQGASILAALQQMHASSSSEAATASSDALSPTEFLFAGGTLVGNYRRVKALLFTDALADVLACGGSVACAMDAIRVDQHSDAGFIVLGPRQCVQSIRCGERPRASLRAYDPLVEMQPLDTVDELLRHASDPHVAASAALLPRVPLAERTRSPTRRSRLLVCHDMKGGYLDDRLTQGSAAFDAYRLYQWDLLDLFVYFGHHLVCIPPLGWIAAGHRNGVRVLGAVVIEGDSGSALATQLFQDRASAEQGAAKLVAIADLYGFDGYLVNIESNLDAALVPNVLVFLQTLRATLVAANAQAQVIWYASLAPTGKLARQRRLDSAAIPFFECVDGLFTDYGWTLDDAKVSAARNLDRRFDVYMGIDVFGRHGTLGGGKLASDVALRAAWNAGVSAALFAPGWTHECLQHEASEDFVTVEDRFWTVVRSGWRARSPCFSAFGGRDALYSAFNVGRGSRVWVDGVPHTPNETKWSNLLEMDHQPVAALHAGVTVRERDSEVRAVLTHDTAFQGGACVSVQGTVHSKDRVYVKLFDTDIALSARHVTEVSYTTAQSINGSVALLVLTLCPGLDRAAHQVILRSDASDSSSSSSSPDSAALSAVAGTSSGKHFYAPVWTRTYGTCEGASATGDELTWVKKTYRLGGMLWDAKHIVEVGLLCAQKTGRAYHANVGEVCIAGRPNASARSKRRISGAIAAEPVACADAHVTWCKRLDRDSVQLQVQWAFDDQRASGSGSADVQYVLVYVCDRSDGDTKRTLLGKSFGKSFTVERCPWRNMSPRALLRLELLPDASPCASTSLSESLYHLRLTVFFIALICAALLRLLRLRKTAASAIAAALEAR